MLVLEKKIHVNGFWVFAVNQMSIKWALNSGFCDGWSRNEDRIERSERQTCTKMDSIEAAEEQ